MKNSNDTIGNRSRLVTQWINQLRHRVSPIKWIKVKVTQSHYRSGEVQRVPGSWRSQISRQSAHETCQPYAPAAFIPQGIFLVLISVRGWVDPQGHSAVRRFMSMKNSTIGNRTRDLPTCTAVSQPTAPPRAPLLSGYGELIPQV